MKKEIKKYADPALLRHKAEKLINEMNIEKSGKLNEADIAKLVHEVHVYRIKLKLQNEELKEAIFKAKTDAKKYNNLYDFAPSGYFTLDNVGRICELNLTGATMLGRVRSRLISCNFSVFVTFHTLPLFTAFFDRVFKTRTRQSCEVQLFLKDKPTLFLILTGIVSENSQQCFLTAVDVSERKQA